MKFVTWSHSEGFNVVECEDEQAAEMLSDQESVCLGEYDMVRENMRAFLELF